jgi:hypothetical protein
MSRLFYDDPALFKRGMTWPRIPLRSPQEFNIEEKDSDAPTIKSYLEKVAKLVPSEVIAGYLTLVGFVPAVNLKVNIQGALYVLIFIFCAALTPWYFYVQADKSRPYRIHLALSTLAFAVWAYATSGDRVMSQLYDPGISSIALVAFSLISGAIPLKR